MIPSLESPVSVIDSHTAGEPTRVVIDGGPDLGGGPLAERARRLDAQFADFRRALIREPRGHGALVGALLVEAHEARADFGVIFFNDVGALGMCGHGAIGVARTLEYLGRISHSPCTFDTPAGLVDVDMGIGGFDEGGPISIQNVPSFRLHQGIQLDVSGLGTVVGDVAYGGNWFFLVTSEPPAPLVLDCAPELTSAAKRVRTALAAQGVCGLDGAEIDHIEFFDSPSDAANNSRNFVLCPGGAYDRSPCGTGTSAKLACLASDGLLADGATWRQESLLGTVFEASFVSSSYADAPGGTAIVPTISSPAFITAETTLFFDPRDPLRAGV